MGSGFVAAIPANYTSPVYYAGMDAWCVRKPLPRWVYLLVASAVLAVFMKG